MKSSFFTVMKLFEFAADIAFLGLLFEWFLTSLLSFSSIILVRNELQWEDKIEGEGTFKDFFLLIFLTEKIF